MSDYIDPDLLDDEPDEGSYTQSLAPCAKCGEPDCHLRKSVYAAAPELGPNRIKHVGRAHLCNKHWKAWTKEDAGLE